MLFGDGLGRRRGGVLAALAVALTCGLLSPAGAGAELYVVDSKGDAVDALLGDEICLTGGEGCTLRAAVEEANSSPGEFDEIQFAEEVFEGQLDDTIALGSSITVADRGAINGRECPTAAGVQGPCVGIDGPPGAPALLVDHAEEVEVWGLAVTGAETGVGVDASPFFKLRASWLGVALDGSMSGNGVGVLVGPGSNRSLIGGEGPEQGNVFAANAGDGLDVHGGRNVRILGNRFGVGPDGVTPGPNGGDAVEVVSVGGLEPEGTEIGTRVSPLATMSPQCDGGCNVISGAASHGVDLQGDGGLESPAGSTSVAANYIGLDVSGTTAVPNAGAGVRVGEAARTLVGGASAGEANRINGGSAAVLAGPAAGDLAVRGNLIGVDAAGGMLAPPDDGIVVDSGGLSSQALEAQIVANEIRMEDGVAILQRGQGAWILNNRIFGSQTAIRTAESNAFFGNVIQGNAIEAPAANGILVENDLNEIGANRILGAGAAGIRIQGAEPFGVSGNVIGGDAATDENLIDGSGGAAVEILNVEATDNEVARNRGTDNAGLFIDLVAAAPATEVGPNRGIEPPTFSDVTHTGASGGAVAGATVRVFGKRLAVPGELDAFIGEAVADGAGGWDLAYENAIPAGTLVAATQTVEGATSELAVAPAPAAGPDSGTGAGPTPDAAADVLAGAAARIRPQTKLVGVRVRGRTARFAFGSSQPGSAFLCKLDGKPFDLCRSPRRYRGLGTGKHVFWVRAVDPAGLVDLTPARRKFVVSR